jgi:hypothetical protein
MSNVIDFNQKKAERTINQQATNMVIAALTSDIHKYKAVKLEVILELALTIEFVAGDNTIDSIKHVPAEQLIKAAMVQRYQYKRLDRFVYSFTFDGDYVYYLTLDSARARGPVIGLIEQWLEEEREENAEISRGLGLGC